MAIKGIDISYYQGNVNFNSVKNDGYSFVILRTGYGKSTDSKFLEYAKNAKNARIDVKGVYHFSYALTKTEAVNEAKLAVSLVEKAGLPKSTIIFFDLEYDSVEWAKKNGIILGKQMCMDHTEAFCEEVKRNGYTAGIYANRDYYLRMYEPSFIEKYPFWYADWTGVGQKYNCVARQYSEKGKVAGISGNVDLNEWYAGDIAPIDPPTKIQNENKSVEELAKEVLDGKWGNGMGRIKALTDAGYDYDLVQKRVNELVKTVSTVKPVTAKVVSDVILGLYGNGEVRKEKLAAAGYDYNAVQKRVNEKMKEIKVSPAKDFNKSFAGAYRVKAAALNCRYIPGIMTDNNVCKLFYKDEILTCYGYYTRVGNQNWLLVQKDNTIGYVCADYLEGVR